MQRVRSTDGTEIAYECEGSGHPLICLHGGSGTRAVWDKLRPHLADEYRLVIPDRRGRGESTDATEPAGEKLLSDGYSLDRELEDLQAVVDDVDGTPSVFGHSFGGLVALAAAERLELETLILYEPALLVGDHRDGDLATRMEQRLAAGNREEAMALFVEEAGTVDDARTLSWWPENARLDLTETVIRENYAVEAYELPEEPAVEIPTLLLTGEYGPNHLRDAVFTLEERLLASSTVELAEVGHVATESDPEQVAAAVRSFLGQ